VPGVGERPLGRGRDQSIGEHSRRQTGRNRREQGAFGRLAMAHVCPTPQPALERDRVGLASKGRTLPPRRLTIAVRRHPARPVEQGEIGFSSGDFINKAFKCLDLIGWKHAAAVLPTVVGQMVAARGAEESTAWRQPVDLIALCEQVGSELPQLFTARSGARSWSEHAALAGELLGDDPVRIVDALKAAIRAGAAPVDLSRSLAYAAALRIARFGNVVSSGSTGFDCEA
jgi:hypothetical protein